MTTTTNKIIIVVDITVANCSIRAAKPSEEYQNLPMPNTDVGRVIWWNSVPSDRLNSRIHGGLIQYGLLSRFYYSAVWIANAIISCFAPIYYIRKSNEDVVVFTKLYRYGRSKCL